MLSDAATEFLRIAATDVAPATVHRPQSPMRAIAWATLEDGIKSYLLAIAGGGETHGDKQERLTLAARHAEFEWRWISRTDYDYPFSFVNLCDLFGLDAGALRDGLRRIVADGQRLRMRTHYVKPDHVGPRRNNHHRAAA